MHYINEFIAHIISLYRRSQSQFFLITEIQIFLNLLQVLSEIAFEVHQPSPGYGGLFEVLVLCSCRLKFSRRPHRPQLCRICHICRYSAGTLRSTSWSSLQRVLLGEDNALRGICVLIFTTHRHQGCGIPWHFVWNPSGISKQNTMSGEWWRPLWLALPSTAPCRHHNMWAATTLKPLKPCVLHKVSYHKIY